MMPNIFYLLVPLGFLISSNPVWALSKLGHQVICQTTFEQLNTHQRIRINQLITHLPVSHKKLINQYNYRPKNEAITFAKACTWPDAIKKLKRYQQYQSWHYLNTGRLQPQVNHNLCQQNCITYAIKFHWQQLKQSTSPWQKLQALMFLGHWLGDIHQPLHVSFASDLGGNKSKIINKSGKNKAQKKCNNLHWYWDECLLNNKKLSFQQRVTQQKNAWTKAPIKQWQKDKIETWAQESFNIIQQKHFKYCQQKSSGCIAYRKKITITKSYPQVYYPILTQRLLQASVRLHSLLNY